MKKIALIKLDHIESYDYEHTFEKYVPLYITEWHEVSDSEYDLLRKALTRERQYGNIYPMQKVEISKLIEEQTEFETKEKERLEKLKKEKVKKESKKNSNDKKGRKQLYEQLKKEFES